MSMTREELDRANQAAFSLGADEEEDVFTCLYCGEPTCICDSYSHRGKNLICCRCAMKQANKLNQTVGQWLQDNVWEVK